ncbi:MAG: DUF2357 domain-containing protein [Clostridia bacterium]
MNRLEITHPDFTLTFECEHLGSVMSKAHRNLRSDVALQTAYCCPDNVGIEKVTLDGAELADGETAPAFFFDNTDYAVWVDFSTKPDAAPVVRTMRADTQSGFGWHDKKSVFSGFLNYGNDIGKCDFSFDYTVRGERRQFSLGYEVLSSKLDYHTHFQTIVADIEAEYRMLSLDFLRRTYHAFAHDPSSREPLDLIWWNLFKTWQAKFIKSARLILQKPRYRGRQIVQHTRADRLKSLTSVLENEIAEHRNNPARLYREEIWTPSNDTPENRFFKHALATVAKRHDDIVRQIKTMTNVAEDAKRQMDAMSQELRTLRAHPFFRTVGDFCGLGQESLVLQRADGYAALARVFAILSASYALKEGVNTLETKDIATLYEIWSFIAVKNIVKEKCGGDISIAMQNRGELSRRFVYDLAQGSNSRILFKNAEDGTELAELFYTAKTVALDESDGRIVAPTGGEQKPDIVLRLTKPVGGDNTFKLTYLFDAKYRLSDAAEGNVDSPPDDAINQMHRYRDAIYYQNNEENTHQNRPYRKEVIGGYILFPGSGESMEVRAARFYQSIAKVNIGAFPLRPDDGDRELLRHFIEQLLDVTTTGQDELGRVIPHKGTLLQVDNADAVKETTVFGTTHGREQMTWIHQEGLYNLPVEIAQDQGIISDQDAVKKRWLVLVPAPRSGEKVTVLRIADYVGRISSDELKNSYRYYKRPEYHEYWMWRIDG